MQTSQPARKGPRTSVSAEAFGTWNKKKLFQPPKYEKAPAVREALQKRLEQAFMFSSLNPDELSIILDAMQSIKKTPGELVIVEGEEGDCLYVVESGILTCTKIFVRYILQNYPIFRKDKRSLHFSRSIIQVKPLESSPSSTMLQEQQPSQLRMMPSCGCLTETPSTTS